MYLKEILQISLGYQQISSKWLSNHVHGFQIGKQKMFWFSFQTGLCYNCVVRCTKKIILHCTKIPNNKTILNSKLLCDIVVERIRLMSINQEILGSNLKCYLLPLPSLSGDIFSQSSVINFLFLSWKSNLDVWTLCSHTSAVWNFTWFSWPWLYFLDF